MKLTCEIFDHLATPCDIDGATQIDGCFDPYTEQPSDHEYRYAAGIGAAHKVEVRVPRAWTEEPLMKRVINVHSWMWVSGGPYNYGIGPPNYPVPMCRKDAIASDIWVDVYRASLPPWHIGPIT